MKTAIALHTYDRPHYLKSTLASLDALEMGHDHDLWIFQDGPHPFTRARHDEVPIGPVHGGPSQLPSLFLGDQFARLLGRGG